MKRRLLSLLLAAAMLPYHGMHGQNLYYPELETFLNTSVGGMFPETQQGGELYFSITTEPVKGGVSVREDGSFIYTPREGKLGMDNFWYRTSDGEGNISEEKAIYIRILPQNGGAHYEDMQGNAAGYAAAKLSEKGLFTGEQLLGRYCFCPTKPVSRGEFLSICMELAGTPVFGAVLNTGREDDAAIPVWMKTYVLTANVKGVPAGAEACFRADEAISVREAAEIAEQLLGLEQTEDQERDAQLTREQMALLLEAYLK